MKIRLVAEPNSLLCLQSNKHDIDTFLRYHFERVRRGSLGVGCGEPIMGLSKADAADPFPRDSRERALSACFDWEPTTKM
jgi:hypothetical protein